MVQGLDINEKLNGYPPFLNIIAMCKIVTKK